PPFPELARAPHTEITGGGPFRVEAGQVTDDSQMATCLGASLMERGGFDVADVAERYVEWRRHAFDIGTLTAESLGRIEGGALPEEAGRAAWEASGRRAAGNGSLMRTAPIAVFFWNDAPARRA